VSAMIVPKGWEIKRLGELVDIVGGGTPARDIEEYWKKGSIPWVTVKDLHQKLEISDSEERITEFGLKNSAANLIPPQNIITPTRMSLGRFFINSVHITINQDLKALKPKKTIFPLFLLWNLLQYGTKLEALGTGTTVKGITLPDLKNLQLPVPSFPEQQKIATILSTLDRTIEATEKLINKEKMVKKGLMADLLTHGIDEQGRIRSPQTHTYVNSPLGMIPEGWEVKAIEKLILKVMDFRGKTPLKIGMDWGGGMIHSLSANNVQMGRINFDKETHLGSEELYDSWMNKGDTKKDDIVFTMEAPLGNVALIPDSRKYILSQRVVLLRPNDYISPRYLFNYLMSDFFQNTLLKYSSGSTVKGIQYSKLKEIEIRYPTKKIEQQKIIVILSAQDRKIETEEINLAKLQNLKKGLMGDLLSGKVRVK